jgi:hypothetical protein
MVKLKTVPSLGTRKLNLPFVGEVEIVDGVFEVEADKVKDLTSAKCGLVIVPVDAKIGDLGQKGNKPKVEVDKIEGLEDGKNLEIGEQNTEDVQEGGTGVSKESLQAMRVKDLDEVFDQIKESLTPEQVEEYPKLKKQERVDFLFDVING